MSPGDDPAVIGSGPTVADGTTFAEARALIARYGITPPPAVAERLARDDDETPKPGSLPNTEFRLIATPMMALDAMAVKARTLGLAPLILGDALEGEAAQMGTVMAGIARSVRAHGQPLHPPAVLLSGGETTVTLSGTVGGKGGRNTTFLLGLAIALDGASPDLGDRRRHRRHRRHERDCRRAGHPGHAGARARPGTGRSQESGGT